MVLSLISSMDSLWGMLRHAFECYLRLNRLKFWSHKTCRYFINIIDQPFPNRPLPQPFQPTNQEFPHKISLIFRKKTVAFLSSNLAYSRTEISFKGDLSPHKTFYRKNCMWEELLASRLGLVFISK